MTASLHLRAPARPAGDAAATGAASPHGHPFTGTRRLVRLVLRRDRIRLPLWVISMIALVGVSARSIDALYTTPLQIRNYVETVGENPALIVFAGPGYGFDDPNPGVILVNETSLWMALAVALMSVFLVNRHTRAEEDSERSDLVRSLVVGHHAPLAATLLVLLLANAAVAVGSVAVTAPLGFPLAGTVALCAGFALVGVTFGAAAAVAAQVAGTGRASLGLGAGLVALAFVVRGIADVAAPAVSWLTPFAWGIGVRAYAGERWVTFAGLVAMSALLCAAAFALSVRRDLGSGLLARRAGPEAASVVTRHPLGLVARLQRNTVLGWLVGVVLAGLVYGSVADDIEAMLADNPQLADYLANVSGATLTESYLATSMRLIAIAIAGFTIASALRLRSDESEGYAEHMLAGPLTRWWWAGCHLVVTVTAACLLLVASGVSVGIAHAASVGDASQVRVLTLASFATIPPVLVMGGLATALFGWLPRATAAAWVGLAFVAVASLLGAVLRFPDWLIELSPLERAPGVPAEPWDVTTLAALTGVAVVLFALGLVGFRRRDLAPG